MAAPHVSLPHGVTRRSHEPVYRITSVGESGDASLTARQNRYLFSMGLRTVCFVAAVLVSGWLQWTLAVAAVVLPYISVVVANAGRERKFELPTVVLRRSRRALPEGRPGADGARRR